VKNSVQSIIPSTFPLPSPKKFVIWLIWKFGHAFFLFHCFCGRNACFFARPLRDRFHIGIIGTFSIQGDKVTRRGARGHAAEPNATLAIHGWRSRRSIQARFSLIQWENEQMYIVI
jgi:hypothetical protein